MRFGQKVGRQLLALSMLITAHVPAVADVQYPEKQTLNVAHSLLSVLRNCPNRIWPDLKATNLDMLLVNKDISNQLLVSARHNTISTVANESLPPHVFSSTFSLIPFEDRNLLHVDAHYGKYRSTDPSQAFSLAIHEAFHMTDQTSWTFKNKGSRGTTIPLLASPRIARNMLYRSLLAAYQEKSQAATHLGNAKYWYKQWLESDAVEGNTTTDGYEGTARYAEVIATLLDESGCGVTEQELEKMAAQSEIFKGENIIGFQSLDTEGYYVGGLASLILRFQYPNLQWQERVAKGETPVEILLENFKPVPAPVDSDMANRIRSAIKERGLNVDNFIASAEKQMQKETSIYVGLPLSAIKGSYSPHGFFNSRTTSVRYIPMAKGLRFDFADGTHFLAKEDAVFVQLPQVDPCAAGWTVVLDESEVHSRGNSQFEVSNPLFQGSLAAEKKTDSKGRRWLCVFN